MFNRPSSRNENPHEDGYVAVVTVLLVGVLFIFMALAVDITSTRARASELQRIADAAALAGAAGMPDLARAQVLANDSLKRNDPSGKSTVTLSTVPGKPGRVTAVANDPKVRSRFINRTDSVHRSAFAEQAVGIPMGTPYNSIGTGDLPGFVPGKPNETVGYFLAINGQCTAKEDGDRFMSQYDGIRGSSKQPTAGKNPDAYHCADDDRAGHLWTEGEGALNVGTPRSQWMKNTEYRAGGYSYTVDVPCPGGAKPCAPGTPLVNPVFVDVWDPFFLAWEGGTPCINRTTGTESSCVIDKVPNSEWWRNWVVTNGAMWGGFKTHFAIYEAASDDTYPNPPFVTQTFYSTHPKALTDGNYGSANWPCHGWWDTLKVDPASSQFCKNWFAINSTPITKSGRYRVQVMADPAIPKGGVKFSQYGGGIRYDGGRSVGMNAYALRVRRASAATQNSFSPCSTELDPECATITGEGALSVYVRTPGNSELFLAKMAPAAEYRGRTIEIQLFDPGEGAKKIYILMPTKNGYKKIDFTYNTSAPGLADYTSGIVVKDEALGWNSGVQSPVSTNEIDVSGDYSTLAPPWSPEQRYSQFKFNGRLLTLNVVIPNDYGKQGGADLAPADYEGGWWKIGYESGGGVEDRTTWVVNSSSAPVRLTRNG